MQGGSNTLRRAVVAAVLGIATGAAALAQNPWADQVVSYDPGADAQPGYTDAAVVLGSPERMTGEGTSWPGAVTPFNGPWMSDEVVSIGAGGSLTVRFDEPITDDPSHLFGVDFLIFGNGSFLDADWPNGVVGGLFEEGPFTVLVSEDGLDYVEVATDLNDALFPTLGYLDLAGPYDVDPGSVPSDFTRPIDPSLTPADFDGKTFPEIVAMYDGSGGGIPLDIGVSGLSEVNYVKIEVPAGATSSPEFDAFAVVPEPSCAALICAAVVLCALRKGR